MASANTFTISRIEIRRVLLALKVSEKSIEGLIAAMEKSHRHINVVSFVSLLEKAGLERDDIVNVLRRLGMDDVMINGVMGMVDEKRITSEIGRVYEADVVFG
ncbi:MAG: hypothetical protein M1279_01790 [Candidatus Marsarchaeota archaeon]|jgi:hypothetical protein|nr:hypothetical protein [Candidatus Marsarchaeota archaeon]